MLYLLLPGVPAADSLRRPHAVACVSDASDERRIPLITPTSIDIISGFFSAIAVMSSWISCNSFSVVLLIPSVTVLTSLVIVLMFLTVT